MLLGVRIVVVRDDLWEGTHGVGEGDHPYYHQDSKSDSLHGVVGPVVSIAYGGDSLDDEIGWCQVNLDIVLRIVIILKNPVVFIVPVIVPFVVGLIAECGHDNPQTAQHVRNQKKCHEKYYYSLFG